APSLDANNEFGEVIHLVEETIPVNEVMDYVFPKHSIHTIVFESIHKADLNANGCIDINEMLKFIDLWYYDSISNTIAELIEALDMWTRPDAGCLG
ncbi:MAG: hypothetical protein ABIH52_04810, partial [Candidatus Aenigmatarchaeota archaeon]